MSALRSTSTSLLPPAPRTVQRTPGDRCGSQPENGKILPARTALELCSALSRIGINISEEQLRQPTLEQLYPIYLHLVHSIRGTAPGPSENRVHFCRNLLELLSKAGVNDYSLSDIIDPDSKKNRKALNMLYNFLEFRNTRYGRYSTCYNEKEQWKERIQQADMELAQLQSILATQINDNEANASNILQAKAACTELLEMVKAKVTEKQILENNLSEITSKLQISDAEISSLRLTVEQISQEVSHHRSEIVTSPDRLSQESRVVNNNLETLKNELEEAEASLGAYHQLLGELDKSEIGVQACIEKMKEIDNAKKQWKAAKYEMNMIQNQYRPDHSIEEELRALALQKAEISRRMNELFDPLMDTGLMLVSEVPMEGDEQEILTNEIKSRVEQGTLQIHEDNRRHEEDLSILQARLLDLDQKVSAYISTLQQSFEIN